MHFSLPVALLAATTTTFALPHPHSADELAKVSHVDSSVTPPPSGTITAQASTTAGAGYKGYANGTNEATYTVSSPVTAEIENVSDSQLYKRDWWYDLRCAMGFAGCGKRDQLSAQTASNK